MTKPQLVLFQVCTKREIQQRHWYSTCGHVLFHCSSRGCCCTSQDLSLKYISRLLITDPLQAQAAEEKTLLQTSSEGKDFHILLKTVGWFFFVLNSEWFYKATLFLYRWLHTSLIVQCFWIYCQLSSARVCLTGYQFNGLFTYVLPVHSCW